MSSTSSDEKDVKLDKKTPEWRSEYNLGRKYEPSYNIAPTDITPVLVSMDHFTDDETVKKQATHDRLLVPMMWGMIPFWHKVNNNTLFITIIIINLTTFRNERVTTKNTD